MAAKALDYEYVEVPTPQVRPPMGGVRVTHVSVVDSDESGEIENPDGGVFRDARKAVQFLATLDGSPRRPLSSRMLDKRIGAGSLAGLDAAAQAGMVLNEIERLGRLLFAILVASCAPRIRPCYCGRPCCSGRKINHYWHGAIHTIAQEAVKALPAGSKISYRLREAIVVKIYGGKENFKDIAKLLNLDEETVSRQFRSIQTWLKGCKAKKGLDPVVGQEAIAWREAESALRDAGIVA